MDVMAQANKLLARHQQDSGALLMLPGNVYNFGRELPPVLTPATVERGDVPKARIRIETEARIAAMPGLHSVVIRAGEGVAEGRATTHWGENTGKVPAVWIAVDNKKIVARGAEKWSSDRLISKPFGTRATKCSTSSIQ